MEFHIPKYDGPLDLLLALIQKNEVNIYDIPIATITDQFLEYLHKAQEIGLGDLTDFYKMAADLIWIKSQMMLPKDVEFDSEYIDPREELVERLLEYSKYKKYSELLMGTEDAENFVFSRKENPFNLPFSDDELLEDVTLNTLMETFYNVLKSYKVLDNKVFNVWEEVSENEKITLMNELLEKKDSIKFSDIIVDMKSPTHVICSFLAVLEAVKDKIILIEQPQLFGDMTITKRPADYNANLADDYDNEYDEIVTNNLEDTDDYSVIEESEEE